MEAINLLLEAQLHFEYGQNIRRDLHRHPELGFKEERTSQILARELRSMGYEVQEGIGRTGVIGLLRNPDYASPVIMLRADMDALPIQEQNETDYVSEEPGVMHACGHDAHMAIALMAAKILREKVKDIQATIKIVFQPAEEGLGGAEELIKAGILEDPKPDYCLGLHVWNEKPVGWVGINPGPVMAGSDTFGLKISGKGGHGGHPHLSVDPIPAAAQIITSAQSIISRNLSPLESGVLSFGSIHGGGAFNVIPDVVEIGGTIRSYKPEIRKIIIERLQKIVHHTSEANGCSAELVITEITPSLINNANVSRRILPAVNEYLPGVAVQQDFQTMVSEDFAFYLQEIPGCFMFVGSANEAKNLSYSHHHPKFDIDETAMPIGAAMLVAAVFSLMG